MVNCKMRSNQIQTIYSAVIKVYLDIMNYLMMVHSGKNML